MEGINELTSELSGFTEGCRLDLDGALLEEREGGRSLALTGLISGEIRSTTERTRSVLRSRCEEDQTSRNSREK